MALFSWIVRRAAFVMAAAAVSGCAGSPTGLSPAASRADASTPPATVVVKIDNFAYMPKAIVVKAGTTIKFVNKDYTAHTVTALNRSFSSPILSTGKSWKRTFKTVGTFKYTCKFHIFMKGVVKVTS